MNRIIHGDCLARLKALKDNSVDLICTDPPYGYSFMGKDWDKAIPSVSVWKECLRVLKPGAFAFVMSAPRQDVLSRMIARICEAGFDTDFTSIYWTYASGFPKAANIGKMVDKRLGIQRQKTGERKDHARKGVSAAEARTAIGAGSFGESRTEELTRATSPEAQALDGSYGGFQPKPAVEVVLIAMKPLSEKTFVAQALKNGKGVTWLDACRIPLNGDRKVGGFGNGGIGFAGDDARNVAWQERTDGRFPANLLVSDNALNDEAARRPGRGNRTHGMRALNHDSKKADRHEWRQADGIGPYSRYFDLDAWWAKTFPFLIVAKASRKEKNTGCDGLSDRLLARSGGAQRAVRQGKKRYLEQHIGLNRVMRVKNNHPTVKPLKLMAYLLVLGSRHGNLVLDPFVGSGTTCVAAKMLGRRFVGIEKEREYVAIARVRLKAASAYPTALLAVE